MYILYCYTLYLQYSLTSLILSKWILNCVNVTFKKYKQNERKNWMSKKKYIFFLRFSPLKINRNLKAIAIAPSKIWLYYLGSTTIEKSYGSYSKFRNFESVGKKMSASYFSANHFLTSWGCGQTLYENVRNYELFSQLLIHLPIVPPPPPPPFLGQTRCIIYVVIWILTRCAFSRSANKCQ